jgi:outer membrane protein
MGLKLNKFAARYLVLLIFVLGGTALAQTPLSLEEAIRLSGEHSYGVKAAHSDSLAARYDLGVARALRYPTASLAATSYYINKLQSVALPFSSLTVGSHENYQADFRLTLPLWTGGRIGSQIDIQGAQAEARGANLESARLTNAYNTRKAYLGLLAAQSLLKAAAASSERISLIGEDTQSRYTNGIADSVDLLNSDLSIQRAQEAVDQRTTAQSNARSLLARLVGVSPESITTIGELLNPNIQIYQNNRPLKESIERPELRIQESRVKAASFVVSLNQANYLPTLNGFGGYSVGKPNKNMLGSKWNDYWTAGFSLNWDFSLGNKTGQNISSARQAAKSAQEVNQDLKESFYLQANTAYDNLLLSFRSYESSKKEFEIASRQYALGKQKEQAGGLSLYRLLELEADLSSSEELFRVSTINYYLSETEYLYAIGSPKIYGGLSR